MVTSHNKYASSVELEVIPLSIFTTKVMTDGSFWWRVQLLPNIPVNVTLDISGSPIESKWGSGNIQGNLTPLN